MLVIAALTGEDDGRRATGAQGGTNQDDAEAPAVEEEEAPDRGGAHRRGRRSPASRFPIDVVGQEVKDVEKALKELGLDVEKVHVESDEFEKHLVVAPSRRRGPRFNPARPLPSTRAKGPPKEDKDEEDD